MDKKVICPNCGASNETTSDTCQFCGTSLEGIEVNMESEGGNSDSSSKITITKITEKKKKGRPQIKYDERVFELIYDEMEDEAELYLSDDIISLEDEFKHYKYYFNFNYLWLGTIKTIVSEGLKYEFHDSISIEKENLDLLETFCNLNPKDCKISEISEGKEFLFILVCRAFYNTIFDHSKYTDATDKLYDYYLHSDVYRQKEEEEEARNEAEDDERMDKRASRGVNGCIIIFALLFLVIPFLGTIAFPDTWLDRFGQWLMMDVFGGVLRFLGFD